MKPIFSFLLLALSCLAQAAERPHVILVMADDQGWGDMGYNGHPLVKTPNFDDAAARGLRFDRFYAAAPVCSPTRASVLTGRNPNRLGVYQWGFPIRNQEVTLAEVLKHEGYTTGHFGKWHLGSVRESSESRPGAHGFDRWVSAPNFYENGATLSDEGRAVTFEGVESSFIAVDSALDWMKDSLKEEKPIFAVIWFGSPHSPHIAADEDAALYADEDDAVKNFLGEVTGMDRAYGKLREELEEMGIRENTLLWYCSDNGALPKVGSSGGFRGNKGHIYEGGLLVPSIVEWPARFPEHRVIESRGNTFDIFPTVLEAVGVALPEGPDLDGESLISMMEGEGESRNKPMGFWDTSMRGIGTPSEEWMQELKAAQAEGRDLPPNEDVVAAMAIPDPPKTLEELKGHLAWIDGDWKLHHIIHKKTGKATFELYHLKSDPYEEVDLSEEEPERVAKMKEALKDWSDSVLQSLNGADYR
ncbi:MAG: sulfatase-like hydrolase/transferase [Verrucomicrobiales bacterium]|nr:sulfatase-like hydrolase/transferase [Verrucomicrobiales bacterium]